MTPQFISRSIKIRHVAAQWKNTFCPKGEWRQDSLLWSHPGTASDHERIYNALVDLGDSPDPNRVDAITEQPSLSAITCDSCKADVENAIEFHIEIPDSLEEHIIICRTCLDVGIRVHDQYAHKEKLS